MTGDLGEDYSQHYSLWHSTEPEHVERMVEAHRVQLAPLVDDMQRGRALDIGCGMGFAVLALGRLGFDSEGVEVDEAQWRACVELGVDAHCGDVDEFLSTSDARFRVILLLDVLEHLPKDRQIATLRMVRRALLPGGRLVITTPNAASPLAPYWRYLDFTHTTSFTVHSLRYVLKNSGFTSVDFVYEPLARRPPVRLWRRSARRQAFRWALRWTWLTLIDVEVGDTTVVPEMPLDLNLTCVAS